MKKAVLFIIFNRLDTTQKVFEQIRLAAPPKLYIASDGARENIETEKELVENTRKWVLANIDWECEIKTLFQEQNYGCALNIPKAINWFLSQEKDGIILEDDCIPSKSFFEYCELALDKYADNPDIWCIVGCNTIPETIEDDNTYAYPVKCMNCWGWATWADRWKYFNPDLKNFDYNHICRAFNKISYKLYWLRILYRYNKTNLNSWAYPWALNIIQHKAFSLVSPKNLISNIGFDGAHYKQKNKKSKILLRLKNNELDEINLPDAIEYNNKYDNLMFKHFYRINSFMVKFILRWLSELITFNFNGESCIVLKQVFSTGKGKINADNSG